MPANINRQPSNKGINTGFLAAQLQQIQQLIAAALSSTLSAATLAPSPPKPPDPQEEPGLQGQPGPAAPGHCKTEDVSYFNPDLPGKESVMV